MFHNQILELQSQLHYHQQQIEETEQELYQLKAFQSYGDQAFACVQEAISHIDGKYLDAFKEALLSLFDTHNPISKEEVEQYIEYISNTIAFDPEEEIVHIGFKDQELGEEWAHQLHYLENYGHRYIIEEAEHLPDYPLELKIKGVTIEDARTLDRIYDFTNPPVSDIEEEKPKKTYYELTGRPDLRPTTYNDLAPNITYSSEGRCYIGFNDYKEAESFRERLSVPSMISEAEIMNAHKWELKFYADSTYVKELQKDFDDDFEQDEDWTPEQKEELDFQERLIRPAPDIFYDPKNNVCYMGFSNKERANNYGALLKEVHEFTTDYHVTNPTVVTNCKYELQFMCSKDNAIRLAPLNLKKGLDHPSNQSIVNQWVRKELPPVVSNKGYPKVEISELEIADVIARSPNGKAFFEVDSVRKEDGEPFAYCKCIKHPIFPGHVGEMFSFKEVYLVSRGEDIREVS